MPSRIANITLGCERAYIHSYANVNIPRNMIFLQKTIS